MCYTNQGSTAQKNHEYNKGFKPGVFDNLVAGFSQIPPCFSSKLFGTSHITMKISNTSWKWETTMKVWNECTCIWRVAQETSCKLHCWIFKCCAMRKPNQTKPKIIEFCLSCNSYFYTYEVGEGPLDNFPLFQDISETLDSQNSRSMGRDLMLQKPFSVSAQFGEHRQDTLEQKVSETEKVNCCFQYCSIISCLAGHIHLFICFWKYGVNDLISYNLQECYILANT